MPEASTTTPATPPSTLMSNAVTSAQMNVALDQEVIMNFRGEYDRLAEILGIFHPEVMPSGQSLYQLKIVGSLNNSKDEENGTSSGTEYVEGDIVALSQYEAKRIPIGEIDIEPYRKVTSAKAINRAGYEVAVMRTDRKMLSNVRGGIVNKFFKFLENGTGEASGAKLQALLANVDATLGDTLETNGDEATEGIVHFVSRQDAAVYLGEQTVTTQTAFGLTYLADFLGVQHVFLTNKVQKGDVFATPVENIHVYGLDFANLSNAGLAYTTDGTGLIGVAHTPAYDRVSAETHMLNGLTIVPEITDYIVKGTIAPKA